MRRDRQYVTAATPGFGTALRKFGALPACPEHAERALSLDAGVMVYPGGDWEAYRPWTQRNRIDFHDHVGFVRLALRLKVPVFPVVSHGSHESLIVVSRGDRLARLLRLDRLRINVFPIMLGIPFGIGPVLVPNVPLPAKVLVEVLEPLDWGHLGRDAAHDPDVVRACYDEITTRMQQALDRLVRELPHPVWRRLLGAVGLAGSMPRGICDRRPPPGSGSGGPRARGGPSTPLPASPPRGGAPSSAGCVRARPRPLRTSRRPTSP